MRPSGRVYPPGKLPLKHHLFLDEDRMSDELSQAAAAAAVGSSSRFDQRPLLAVPFKWEREPGVPKQKLNRLLREDEEESEKSNMALCSAKSSPPTGDRDCQQSSSSGRHLFRLHPSPSPSPSSSSLSSSSSSSSSAVALAPPPRLMVISSSTGARKAGGSVAALHSPRSPRSISLARKMKSLLQGKLSSPKRPRSILQRSWELEQTPIIVQEQAQDTEDELDAELERHCHSRCSSNDIVFEGDQLQDLRSGLQHHRHPDEQEHPRQQQQQKGVMPFKNMSSMLLELWYGGSAPCCSSGKGFGSQSPLSNGFLGAQNDSHRGSSIVSSSTSSSSSSPSSSSSEMESPGSSSTDNSISSFGSDSSTAQQHQGEIFHVPEFKTSFDSCDDEAVDKLYNSCCYTSDDNDDILDFDDDDDIYGARFSASCREFFAKKLYYQPDRFRVESCESPSLLSSSSKNHATVAPLLLPSALKSTSKISSKKCLKKVRFACAEEAIVIVPEQQPRKIQEYYAPEVEEDGEIVPVASSPSPTSPVLSRFSSRPASRFDVDGNRFYDEFSSSEPCSPSPRAAGYARRDSSHLLLRIIQADLESNNKKNRGSLTSVFRSQW